MASLKQVGDIDAETRVEDVVESFPTAVGYLLEAHGIRVICCGTAVWATLGQIARTRGLEPLSLVEGLRRHLGGDRSY